MNIAVDICLITETNGMISHPAAAASPKQELLTLSDPAGVSVAREDRMRERKTFKSSSRLGMDFPGISRGSENGDFCPRGS